MLFTRSFLAALGIALAATAAQAQSTPPPPSLPSAPSAPATTAPAAPAPAATPANQGVPAAQPVPTASARSYPPSSLTFSLGWGAPYAFGLEFSHMMTPNLDLNAGVGIGVTGGKIGVGTRYYFSPQRKISPFVGANLVRTGGIDAITIEVDNGGQLEFVECRFNPSTQFHLRGGIRWQPTFRFGMIGAVGYGINLGGSPVVYLNGQPSQFARDVIEIIAPGGVEVSLGFAIGLGRRN